MEGHLALRWQRSRASLIFTSLTLPFRASTRNPVLGTKGGEWTSQGADTRSNAVKTKSVTHEMYITSDKIVLR